MMTMVVGIACFVAGFIWGVLAVALMMANEEKEQKGGEAERWED